MKFEKLCECIVGGEELLPDSCPTCGKPVDGRTRGMFAHHFCEDGHQWWKCKPHGKVYTAKTPDEMNDMTTPQKSSHPNALGCTDDCINLRHKEI